MKFAHKRLTNNLATTQLYDVDFHRFIELASNSTHIEIAQELGISLKEVHMLKKKLRSTLLNS